MGRWVGIDYGERRIGVALSDPRGGIATPAATLKATGSTSKDARRISQWAAENEAAGVVVGLPLNMDGSVGPQAQLAQKLADELRRLTNLPVELWDERLTSFEADEVMRAARLSRAKQKRRRDALAAQAILQSFLDARRDGDEAPSDE